MSNLDKEILLSFIEESFTLVQSAEEILELVESDFTQILRLQDYGNLVDRIMGGAQSLAVQMPALKSLSHVGDMSALCKSVSYKASSVKNNQQLVEISVALLLDATEVLKEVLNELKENLLTSPVQEVQISRRFSKHFLERLKWAAQQFPPTARGTLSSNSEDQVGREIDYWIKKLGLG